MSTLITKPEDLIGKTIKEIREFTDYDMTWTAFAFTDGTFTVLESEGDEMGGRVIFATIRDTARLKPHPSEWNDLLIWIGWRTEEELAMVLAEHAEQCRLNEERRKSVRERFPTLVEKGIIHP